MGYLTPPLYMDGTTDDSAAFQELVDSRSIVELPAGTMKIDGTQITIPANCRVIGKGRGATTISCINPAASQKFLTLNAGAELRSMKITQTGLPPSGQSSIINTASAGAVLRDLQVTGPGIATTSAALSAICVQVLNAADFVLEDSLIEQADGTYGLELNNADRAKVRRTRFYWCGADGIKIHGGSHDCLVDDCDLDDNGQSGVGKQNLFSTNGNGIDMVGAQCRIINSRAYNNESTGFQIKTTIAEGGSTGNTFEKCVSRDNLAHGFAIENSGGETTSVPIGNRFVNCEAYSNGNSGFRVGSILEGGLYGHVWNTDFESCQARSNTASGFNITEHCRGITMGACRVLGNNTGTGTSGYNMLILAPKYVRIFDLFVLGVDPVEQGLETDADITNAANARCRGIQMYRTGPTSSANTMEDVVIVGLKTLNHSFKNIDYFEYGLRTTKHNFRDVLTVLDWGDFRELRTYGITRRWRI